MRELDHIVSSLSDADLKKHRCRLSKEIKVAQKMLAALQKHETRRNKAKQRARAAHVVQA